MSEGKAACTPNLRTLGLGWQAGGWSEVLTLDVPPTPASSPDSALMLLLRMVALELAGSTGQMNEPQA